MAIKVLIVFWILVIGKGLLWCNEKCVCQDENAKLFCRGLNEMDLFLYTEFTKEIEVRKNFVGLKWLTDVFENLDKVTVVNGDLLDCASLYIVKVVGDCVTTESTDMAVVKPEVVTKDVVKMIKKSTFDISISLVVVCSVILNVFIIVLVHLKLKRRYLRIREERLAYMSRALAFDFDPAEEERANKEAEQTELKKLENKGKNCFLCIQSSINNVRSFLYVF